MPGVIRDGAVHGEAVEGANRGGHRGPAWRPSQEGDGSNHKAGRRAMVVLIHFSRQSMPLRLMRSVWWPFSTSRVSPPRTETTGPEKSAIAREGLKRNRR